MQPDLPVWDLTTLTISKYREKIALRAREEAIIAVDGCDVRYAGFAVKPVDPTTRAGASGREEWAGFDKPAQTRRIRPHPRAHFADGTGIGHLTPTVVAHFDSAVDFVAQYADHFTQGGMFVAGNFRLEPLSKVELHLEVPGFGVAVTGARVAFNAKDGVGLDISCADESFFGTLHRMLLRLGQRREVSVITSIPSLGSQLEAAGFLVQVATHPAQIVRLFSAAQGATAVVVEQSQIESTSGFVDPSFVVPYQADFELLVAALDALD